MRECTIGPHFGCNKLHSRGAHGRSSGGIQDTSLRHAPAPGFRTLRTLRTWDPGFREHTLGPDEKTSGLDASSAHKCVLLVLTGAVRRNPALRMCFKDESMVELKADRELGCIPQSLNCSASLETTWPGHWARWARHLAASHAHLLALS